MLSRKAVISLCSECPYGEIICNGKIKRKIKLKYLIYSAPCPPHCQMHTDFHLTKVATGCTFPNMCNMCIWDKGEGATIRMFIVGLLLQQSGWGVQIKSNTIFLFLAQSYWPFMTVGLVAAIVNVLQWCKGCATMGQVIQIFQVMDSEKSKQELGWPGFFYIVDTFYINTQ